MKDYAVKQQFEYVWPELASPQLVLLGSRQVAGCDISEEGWTLFCSAASRSYGSLYPVRHTNTDCGLLLVGEHISSQQSPTFISISPLSSSSYDPAWTRMSAVAWEMWIFMAATKKEKRKRKTRTQKESKSSTVGCIVFFFIFNICWSTNNPL